MYKKYVHPVYNWYNEEYKQLDENTFVSSKGKIVTSESIAKETKHDHEKVESGEYKKDLTEYGLLDSTEVKFTSKVIENLEELHKTIIGNKIDIARIEQMTGVHFEI